MRVSAVITTYNEESNIEQCLETLAGWIDEIILVDGTSTDKTVELARKYTKHVYVRPNEIIMKINNQYGIEKATSDWIFIIDADERVPFDLAEEVKSVIKANNECCGFYLPRRNYVFGRWMHYGGHYPDYQLRLFKKNCSFFKGEHVHESVSVNGKLGYLEKALDHNNYVDINHHLKKLIFYTDFESKYFFDNNLKISRFNSFWYLALKPLAKSFRRYILHGGFRNGLAGFIFEVHCLFLEFTIFSKLWELQNTIEEVN